jgi:bis(5'-nucleosyl)-tetraphosphatase (symmetrical)
MQEVFIGDVQGCIDEFEELLRRVHTTHGEESRLWLTGDLVNRGPGNLRILERIRRLVEDGRAHMVLGNHDLGLLRAGFGLFPLLPTDTIGDILESAERDDWLEWLRRQPLIQEFMLGRQRGVVIHAAPHPDWKLAKLKRRLGGVAERLAGGSLDDAAHFLSASPEEDRDLDLLARVTRCRSIGASGAWSDELPGEGREAWHACWARNGHDYGVVYGHWALQGLHVASGLRGLDTGCVHHGRDGDGFLTAWTPDPTQKNPFDLPDRDFIQVRGFRKYWRDDS